MEQDARAAKDSRSYTDGAAFVDGQFLPVGEARVPILDWGFLRSDATYDVAHVWRGSFFRLEDHLDRFERSMEHLHLGPPHDRSEIRDILVECVRLSGLSDAYAEIICTRGIPRPGSRDPRDCENRFYAFVVPFIWIADPEKQERGLHAVIGSKHRIAPESVDPTVKNYHWLDLETGLLEAYERGGETVILVDAEDEVFLSSTAGGVIPVTTVDGEAVGNGEPGPVTRQLRDAYWDLHDDPRFSLPVHYD